MVSTRISPYTPTELVHHSPPQPFPIPFGRPCMVSTFEGTRKLHATQNITYSKLSPKMELGLCMGQIIEAVPHSSF
jgi:hypothetical protein